MHSCRPLHSPPKNTSATLVYRPVSHWFSSLELDQQWLERGFHTIVSLMVACFLGSYGIPIDLLAWRRATSLPLKLGPWNPKGYHLTVNTISVCWLIVIWVFAFFSIAIPVAPANMN